MAILAALLLSQSQPSIASSLQQTAAVVASELDVARSLAITNGSQYRVVFDVARNKMRIRHVGANRQLDTVPLDALHPPDPSGDRVTRLEDLRTEVELAGVLRGGATVSFVEFNELGETGGPAATKVWLTAGRQAARRYLAITIDPVTGLATVGLVTKARPPGLPDPDAVPGL